MELAKLTMPFGCSATLRSLSHFLQLLQPSFGQLLCPSCHFIHFVLRSATLHPFVAMTICFKAWHTYANTQSKAQVMHMPFRKANATILTGFHSATLVLHSFQSHSVHPLPIFVLALLACHSFGFVMVFDQQHKP